MVEIELASYKDPSGYIFYFNHQVYRCVVASELSFFADFVRGDLYRKLVKKQMMVDTQIIHLSNQEQELRQHLPESVDQVFQHQKIEFISYPYEWSVSMCVDAALLTLDIQETLLHHGLSLKDATPYNIQFLKTKPIFIDICSIEKAGRTGIWKAYNQFCQFWLYPLLLYHYGLLDFRAIYLNYSDGMPLDRTLPLIGLRPFWRFGFVIDYLMPALMSKSNRLQAKSRSDMRIKEQSNSIEIQLMTVKRLKRVITKLRKASGHSHWSDYAQTHSYDTESEDRKVKFVRKALERNDKIKKLLDIGCNTGTYSKLATEYGIQVVAVDYDMACIDRLYLDADDNQRAILPLWVDISNPSPAIGWNNAERKSFLDRMEGSFDCVLSLALVHHLLVTHRVPLDFIVRLQSRLSRKFLLTEFIGVEDRMFKQLMRHRSEKYDMYDKDYFKKIHLKYFKIVDEISLIDKNSGMDRALFLMEKEVK